MFRVQKLNEGAQVPTRSNPGDAGYDLYADTQVDIHPHELAMISTGIAISIPPDCYGRVAPRSGLAWKHQLDVFAGVVDSSYRGEIKVLLKNYSGHTVTLNKGDRVAQLIFERIYTPVLVESASLDESDRGAGGFGSSGQ